MSCNVAGILWNICREIQKQPPSFSLLIFKKGFLENLYLYSSPKKSPPGKQYPALPLLGKSWPRMNKSTNLPNNVKCELLTLACTIIAQSIELDRKLF